jgi:hypothetical protein
MIHSSFDIVSIPMEIQEITITYKQNKNSYKMLMELVVAIMVVM